MKKVENNWCSKYSWTPTAKRGDFRRDPPESPEGLWVGDEAQRQYPAWLPLQNVIDCSSNTVVANFTRCDDWLALRELVNLSSLPWCFHWPLLIVRELNNLVFLNEHRTTFGRATWLVQWSNIIQNETSDCRNGEQNVFSALRSIKRCLLAKYLQDPSSAEICCEGPVFNQPKYEMSIRSCCPDRLCIDSDLRDSTGGSCLLDQTSPGSWWLEKRDEGENRDSLAARRVRELSHCFTVSH